MGNKPPSLIRYILDKKTIDDPEKVLKFIERDDTCLHEVLNGAYPIDYALSKNFVKIAGLLFTYLDRGQQQHYLTRVIYEQRPDVLKEFVDTGADISFHTSWGHESLLLISIKNGGNTEISKILIDGKRRYPDYPDYREMKEAIYRNLPDTVELLIDYDIRNASVRVYEHGNSGPLLFYAQGNYRSRLRDTRVENEKLLSAARIIALLLVADPNQINELGPVDKTFVNDAVIREAIVKRVGELAAKRRMGAITAFEARRRVLSERAKIFRTSQAAAAAAHNAVLSGNVETDDDKAPLLSAATSAPVNNPKYEGGLRRLKTQRRHRSTAAKVSKRLRRKTGRKSRK